MLLPTTINEDEGSEKLRLRTQVTYKEVQGQVSTIDLHGINHFGNLFETALYNGCDYSVVDRYPTKQEAIDGHEKWVDELEKYFRGEECLLIMNS